MITVELGKYITELRQQFSEAYEAQRVACEHAVMLMRRLELAEALLETFTAVEPAAGDTEAQRAESTASMEWDLPKRRRERDAAPELPRRAVPRARGLSGMAL